MREVQEQPIEGTDGREVGLNIGNAMRRASTQCLKRRWQSSLSSYALRVSRPISYSACRMSQSLAHVEPALPSTKVGDSFQLISTAEKAGEAEDALFEEQVKQVEQWWASPRYNGIKRPYSAEDVVSKRGALQQTYPSSLMARKLFNLFEERAAKGEPVHTSTLATKQYHPTTFPAESMADARPPLL